MDKAAFNNFIIEVVRRVDKEPGFTVLPRRWVVERTFSDDSPAGAVSCETTNYVSTSPKP